MVKSRREKVRNLLFSGLRSAAPRYEMLIAEFEADLAWSGLALEALGEEELDWILAERVVDAYEASLLTEGLTRVGYLLSALSKAFPRHRYRTAWKALDVWKVRCPPAQAPAIPPELAFAASMWCLMAGQPFVATATLLCFVGLLRASEALMLRGSDLVWVSDGVFLILGIKKKRAGAKGVHSTSSRAGLAEASHSAFQYPRF